VGGGFFLREFFRFYFRYAAGGSHLRYSLVARLEYELEIHEVVFHRFFHRGVDYGGAYFSGGYPILASYSQAASGLSSDLNSSPIEFKIE